MTIAATMIAARAPAPRPALAPPVTTAGLDALEASLAGDRFWSLLLAVHFSLPAVGCTVGQGSVTVTVV